MTTVQSDELARQVAHDGARTVIKRLLDHAAANEPDVEERVAVVMRLLEEMAQHQVDTACCLMLSLWPIASELMLHDVCDAIDLWIWDNRSPAVETHLRNAAASEIDPDVKRHIEGLLCIEDDAQPA